LTADLGDSGPIAGNLPYYVATPIVSRVLRLQRPATFLIQKEVAERITAQPNTRDYGYFSVECQLFANVEYLFTVKSGSFRPPPKVDSAAIRLIPRAHPEASDPEAFLSFVSRAFRQKRKTLRNNLSSLTKENFPESGQRAEQLSLPQFADLFRRLIL
jgi:16S rRNA (adenine1518-N6/adenine1519-N6)-dimethyltransferase